MFENQIRSSFSAIMGLRLLALACLVGAALAGPLPLQEGQRQCAKQCSRALNQPKFGYEIGKTYTYEYRGENVVSATGKPRQKATIEGLAVIHVVDQCEMVLQLKNLRVSQKLSPEEITELTQKLELPVPFSFNDGAVEQVCPSQDEDLQSLNIKKGLISSFVNTMSELNKPQEVKEFDSLGHCMTKYTVQGSEIRKQKSLKSCTNRHSSVTAMITNPYEASDSKIHTLPVFPDEKLECTQIVENKIIKSVQCQEHAQIKPLSQKSSIIKFEGQVELNLLSTSNDDQLRTWHSNWAQQSQSESEESPEASSSNYHASGARQSQLNNAQNSQESSKKWQQSIMFNYEEPKSVKSQERETEQLLRQMCSKNEQSMDITVSKDFIQLVSLVKDLPYSSLTRIHSSLESGRLCSSRKVHDLFVDTLPMAGSDAAIKHMVKLLESKEITGLKAKLWPASLALIPNPSREAVSEVVPLLRMQSSEQESSPPSPVILLGVSAMVHRFCSVHDCEKERSVQEITSILNQQMGRQCSNENEAQILAALKAFGNMGHHGNAEQTILACAQDKDKSARLRLAAIDAFRRITQKRPEKLVQIYRDTQDSSEIRIAAFSSVMKQCDEQQLRTIKRTVEQERDVQVSAYVSSYLKNMKTTSSPMKKSVKRALEQVEINPPKVSYWQNSKNIEFSSFSETFNIGGSVETDIVHSPESKIPQSVTARFDADVLNNNMNIFEIGVRAEGFDAIFKNLLGLKDKIPKSSSPWELFNSESVFGGVEAEASAFIRTMNTEILDISSSDMSEVGEMIKIADLMNQLAQGKSSDFSQSFLFLNSKLIIPSVTGRSYSLGVTGSATVGLTATTKLDIMRFPRNTDAHARFQPSLNVELSTTVGIQSNQHRPDIKLSTRMHLESNLEAQFKIRDGHYAIASVTLPTENVVLARVSSDIVEVDSHHQERPVFEQMQKKVDYCFDKLQKPLGVSICGMLEVPKPFVTRSFPFINAGVGSIEFSIKKTDRNLKSFELKLERPRHAAPVQKFRASFDTPGSQVNRRFAAELDVKRQGEDYQEYSLQLTSPFKNAGGSGSLTLRPELLDSVVEIHSGSSPLLSFKASSQISSSRAKKVFKPSVHLQIGSKSPLQVGGVVSVTHGRKQVISIDIQANKPSRRPMSVRGSITKEGSIVLSKKSEWKISSDLSFESSFFESQVRSMLEKQSKQAETISASIETEYKRGSQRHSMSFSGTAQQSSSKISTNAQFQSTQFPSTSWSLKWERQGKPHQSMKNDIILRYGQNQERSFISVKQSSHVPSKGQGKCNVVVKVPQLNIDSELTVTHELSSSESAHKLQLEADLCYKEDKHIKGFLHFDAPSVKPLRASSEIQLELPSGKLSYSNEIRETSSRRYEGNTQMQWKESRPVQVKYIYQVLSDRSKLHHELDASLQLPSRQSPIQSKCSLEVSRQTVRIDGSLSSRRSPDYTIQAELTPSGRSSLRLQTPKVDGDLKIQNEQQKKAFDLDLRLKGSQSRRVIASTKVQLGQKKSFEVEMSWDADRQPEKKVSFTSKGEVASTSYSVSSQLQIADLLSLSFTESGQKSILGNHQGSVEASIKNHQPIRVDYSHKLSNGQSKCQLKFSRNNVEKVEAKLEMKSMKSSNGQNLDMKASLTSLVNSFQTKEIEIRHSSQKSGSSVERQTSIRIQRSPSKQYKAELSSESQPKGVQIRAQVNTPHKMFSQQTAVMSFQKSDSSISSSLSIELPENKLFSISSEMQKRSHEASATVVVKSPFESAQEIKVHFAVDNHRSIKSFLSYLDVNSARLADVEATMTQSPSETNLRWQLKVSPSPKVKFQGLRMSLKQTKSSLELSGEVQMQGEKTITISSQVSKQRSGISASFSLNTPFKRLQSINTSLMQSKSSVQLAGSVRYMEDKEISVKSEFAKEASKLSATSTLSTPYSLKDAKAHISIEMEPSQKSLIAFIDANGQRKGDVEISYSSSFSGMELKSRMKTAHSQELSSRIKLEKDEKSFTFQAKMVKGASTLLSSRNRLQSESMEQTLLDLQISRQPSSDPRSSDLYSMRLSGPVTPLTLSMSTSRIQGNGLYIEASACQESQSKCYKLKTTQKTPKNSQKYHLHQELSVELEKLTGSRSEVVGTAHLLASAEQRDFISKITVEFQGQTLGYEIRAHKRVNENDHCTIDAHIFKPSETSRFRASVLHSHGRLSLEIEATPDSSVPNKKFALEIQREHKNKNELSGSLKLSSPKSEKPIILTVQMQKQGLIPVQGKWVLQYSSIEGSRTQQKVWTLEVSSHLQQRSQGKKFLNYKLYNADRSISASLEMKKESSRLQDSYGYEWSYQKQSSLKKGGVSIKLSQKMNGRPQHLDITYYTPNVALEIQGRATQAPHVKMSLRSTGQKTKEVKIVSNNNCVELQVLESAPIWKSSLCVNKRVGETLQFVSADAYYRRHKSLDFSVGIDPQTESFITIQMQWDKKDIVRALEEVTGLNELLQDRSLQELEEKLRQEIEKLKNDVIMPVYNEIMDKIRHLKQLQEQRVRNLLEQHQEMLQDQVKRFQQYKESIASLLESIIPWEYIHDEVLVPVYQSLKCVMDSYLQLAMKHIPDISRIIMEATKEQLEYCLKKFCVAGTFCYDIRRVYERQGLQQAQQLTMQKLIKVQQSIQKQCWEQMEQWIPEYSQKLAESIEKYAQNVEEIIKTIIESEAFAKVIEYSKIVSEKVFHYSTVAAEKVLIKLGKIFHIISEDEDFQTIRSMTKFMTEGVENQVKSMWQNRESYVRQLKNIMRKVWELKDELKSQLKSQWENRDEYKRKIRSVWEECKRKIQKVWENRDNYLRKLKNAWENKEKHLRKLQNAWEDKESFVKQELVPLKQSLMSKSKELMQGRLEVPQFDLQQGNIKVLVRHPLTQSHIQVVQNVLRACQQKMQQLISQP
ncbi:apolipophorins-like [Parasteatoda tepidariorum]|uniref:apolipophorins-like n=1 Tax=Parasteatoda tepidariorum TaxID=114398 RepID=UPI00077F8B8D|nr:apolipophorins-like [Parasteatoda tepidariorum]